MRFQDAMYGWDPSSDRIEVGPHPDKLRWSKRFLMTGGSCYTAIKRAPPNVLLAQLFLDLQIIVIRDKVDPQAAHREFLKIDEYRWFISRDTPGAVDAPEDGDDRRWWRLVAEGLPHGQSLGL